MMRSPILMLAWSAGEPGTTWVTARTGVGRGEEGMRAMAMIVAMSRTMLAAGPAMVMRIFFDHEAWL